MKILLAGTDDIYPLIFLRKKSKKLLIGIETNIL